MNINDTKTILREVSVSLFTLSQIMEPEEFMSALMGGVVANVIGSLSDDYWLKAMNVEPCGQPNCDCEKMRERQMVLLDELRKDRRKTLDSRVKHN